MIRAGDLTKRLFNAPFTPFRIHLSDGDTIDILEPVMVIVGRSTPILPKRFAKDDDGTRIAEDWRTVALIHIVQFSDVLAGNGK